MPLDDAAALDLVRSVREPTPLEPSRLAGAWGTLLLKREDAGPNRAFKWRGALCACAAFRADGADAIVTASTGNHGAATAWAARRLGMTAHVVVPRDASETKCGFIEDAGATLHREGADLGAAAAFAAELAARLGVPYFEDGASDAQLRGNGTIAAELAGNGLDAVVVPLAVGALAGGLARRLAALEPDVPVYGVQVKGFDRIAELLRGEADPGTPRARTFADGLADQRVVSPAFDACRDHLCDVVVVDDDEIASALRDLHAADGVLAEGAGAAAIAGLRRLGLGGRVAAIVSGANIDAAVADRIVAAG